MLYNLYEGLERLRDKWPSEIDFTLAEVKESFSRGEFVLLMEQIKYCNLYIGLITGSIATDLRRIGNSIPDAPI
ncbi:hypothetical protein [Spirosoma gilvum]